MQSLNTPHGSIQSIPLQMQVTCSSFAPRSVIEVPLLRIQESDSSDLESVAQFVLPTHAFNFFVLPPYLNSMFDAYGLQVLLVAHCGLHSIVSASCTHHNVSHSHGPGSSCCVLFHESQLFEISHAHRLCLHHPLNSDPYEFICPQTRPHPLRSRPLEGLFAS